MDTQEVGKRHSWLVAVTAGLLAVATFGWSASASAFCGAYVSGGEAELFNNATQVVMMRDGKDTILSMQNNYEGPPKDFAMIVPTPEVLEEENVKILEDAIFEKVDRLTAPRLVEYWEQDPCETRRQYAPGGGTDAGAAFGQDASTSADTGGGGTVKVEAKFTKGEYEIVVLSATESAGLETWLRNNNYNIPQGAAPYLDPYVQQGSKFFVAKVDTQKVSFDQNGQAVLSPLRFNYQSDQFSLPVRLGLINSKGQQDLIVNILARNQRYDVSNYPTTTIPTNLHVVNDVRNHFSQFYRALFRETIKQNTKTVDDQERKPVVTEYAWNANSCDPCPGPNLYAEDYMTLGADVVVGAEANAYEVRRDWVITRLHARYGADEIGRDLVFKKAQPIIGGRGGAEPDSKTAEPSQRINTFQGRYIIRHGWDGAVECEDPQFGVWGGKSGGQPSTSTAPGPTGGASSGGSEDVDVNLEAELHDDIEAIGVVANPGATDDGVDNSNRPGSQNAKDPEADKACSTTGGGAPLPWLVLLVPAIVVARRRD